MWAYKPNEAPLPAPRRGMEDEADLRVAITFNRPGHLSGPTKFAARLSTRSIKAFAPDPLGADLALAELARKGFTLTTRGAMAASMRCTRQQFEEIFRTQLVRMTAPGGRAAQFGSVLFPPENATWNPDPALAALLDDIYIQWPHIYMARAAAPARRIPKKTSPDAAVSGTPPQLTYFHLTPPGDIAQRLNALQAHHDGITGKGIRVAMIDSGFDHSHPYFINNNYSSSVVLAPGAIDTGVDGNGHGTGESANIFALAPGVTFIGVKLDNEQNPNAGASILEGFQEALKHDPHIISISLGYDLRQPVDQPADRLPNNLVALEAEIQAAVAAGKVVVFSAGNGHYSFPGQMPEIISAGGVFVAQDGTMRASDYASAFTSAIYSGRTVPDFCGLVGMLPNANYLSLPIPPGSKMDQECAVYDGTRPVDGWGVFSGTSAAAPQIAGICALLLQADPKLSSSDIKAVLRRTSRDVAVGHANPASDPNHAGVLATSGEDGATGAGLVDAFAAVKQVL